MTRFQFRSNRTFSELQFNKLNIEVLSINDHCGMNESIDGSNTSNVSSTNSNSSNVDMGTASAQESSIGSAGSLAMRNHISNTAKHTNKV